MSAPEEVKANCVIIRFDGCKGIHTRHCVLDRPDVFAPAIPFERLDDAPDVSAPLVNTMRVRESGPLAIHADVEIRRP